MLDYEKAKRTFRYEPETGRLFWAEERPVEDFSTVHGWRIWSGKHAGNEITCKHNGGYLKLGVTTKKGVRKEYLAHRVIWLLTTGAWPDNEIDHINGLRADNRIANLRAVTCDENAKNAKRRNDNLSGVVGVQRCKKSKKWVVRIKAENRNLYVGSYTLKSDAIAARKEADIKYGYHIGHGKALSS